MRMQGFRCVGYSANQVSKQNSKLAWPGGQIIQGTQLVQGALDHCIWLESSTNASLLSIQYTPAAESAVPNVEKTDSRD